VFKYLWMVIQDLFLTVTYTALMHTLLSRAFGRRGRTIHRYRPVRECPCLHRLAIVKFNTKLYISSHWNHYI
jgi:hypothetical protein